MSLTAEQASAVLKQLGLTQKIFSDRDEAAAEKAQQAKISSLSGTPMGPTGGVTANPLCLPAVPLSRYAQPDVDNPSSAKIAVVPALNFDPLRIAATSPPAYIQPDYRKPQPNPPGTVTKLNPLGC